MLHIIFYGDIISSEGIKGCDEVNNPKSQKCYSSQNLGFGHKNYKGTKVFKDIRGGSVKGLIVVDMQKDFCYPEGALYGGDRVYGVIKPLVRFIDAFRTSGDEVIYTMDWHREDDVEFKIWPSHCIEHSEGAEIVEELKPEKNDFVVKKRKYTAFFGTDLDMFLREKNIEEIYLAGVLANICVLHTAADAVLRGYNVTVVKDCIEALSDYDLEYALRHMENILKCEIVESEEILKK